MARLSKEEVEQIIERDLPDYQVVKESLDKEESARSDTTGVRDSLRQGSSDATSPDLDTLRDKLRSRSASASNADANRSEETSFREMAREGSSWSFTADETAVEDETADDVIVAVRPKKSHSPFDVGYRTKAVVISGRSKRVIGRQG